MDMYWWKRGGGEGKTSLLCMCNKENREVAGIKSAKR